MKDHLATKDIMMSSLAQILDSFEVDDELGRKQRLLHYLWPAKPLEEVFKTYLPQHGKLSYVINSTSFSLTEKQPAPE